MKHPYWQEQPFTSGNVAVNAPAPQHRYNGLGRYFLKRFGRPARKIVLDAGRSCPNRDGTLGRGGCAFCNPDGSGRPACGKSLEDQWAERKISFQNGKVQPALLAYLQAYTTTHCPVDSLADTLRRVAALPGVSGACVSARPDCLGTAQLQLLADFARALPPVARMDDGGLIAPTSLFQHPAPTALGIEDAVHQPTDATPHATAPETGGTYSNKDAVTPDVELWIDLGLQSSRDDTLRRINRGHTAACFATACESAARLGLRVCAHVMAGLPGEGAQDFLDTVRFACALPIAGIKLHNLLVVKDTAMATQWRAGAYAPPSREEYVAAVTQALRIIRADVVIHRLQADPAPGELLAPAWAQAKGPLLEAIHAALSEGDIWQGQAWLG